ncbi:MAG TPA: hypothetical protein PKJ98_08750 [Verrucomicrobiota bacterium]|nr:hypothetical protein [Verrucomicrobiota bacterium]
MANELLTEESRRRMPPVFNENTEGRRWGWRFDTPRSSDLARDPRRAACLAAMRVRFAGLEVGAK